MDSVDRTVLIRTRPLGKGNYGGILQAYALQSVLRSLGWSPATDVTAGDPLDQAPVSLRSMLSSRLRSYLTSLDVPGVTREHWVADALRSERDAELQRFIEEHIVTVKLYGSDGSVDSKIVDGATAFITGSDQVWRGAYGRIPSYLFDFLKPSDSRPRIAYAASFGTADLSEYSPEILDLTRQFARRLTAVSVRESSGVAMCRQAWGIESTHVLDPTMLLLPADYRALAVNTIPYSPRGDLVSYVLDESPSARGLVATLGEILKLHGTDLLPSTPRTLRAYRRNRAAYARPSVEQWLDAIDNAGFVLTDSFHGTVFSLIFNRPFATVVNTARGAARFESLLSMLGLESRLIPSPESFDVGHLLEPIDWSSVNERLTVLRRDSLHFLTDALR